MRSRPPASQYVSATGAAELMGVHRDTIRRWADKGIIPSQRSTAGHRLFSIAELTEAKNRIAETKADSTT